MAFLELTAAIGVVALLLIFEELREIKNALKKK
jgi:hypothetical protein